MKKETNRETVQRCLGQNCYVHTTQCIVVAYRFTRFFMLYMEVILLTMSCLHFDNNYNRLILDADNAPIVLPFVHTGMQDVMPVGAKLPRIGKTVCILVSLYMPRISESCVRLYVFV